MKEALALFGEAMIPAIIASLVLVVFVIGPLLVFTIWYEKNMTRWWTLVAVQDGIEYWQHKRRRVRRYRDKRKVNYDWLSFKSDAI